MEYSIPQNKYLSTVSVDCVIFGLEETELKVIIIKHAKGASAGQWALPGDYVSEEENLEAMPAKVLFELTTLKNVFVEHFGTFGKLNRVPNQRVITVAYYALISPGKYVLEPGQYASEVKWVSVKDLPQLVFDHNELVQEALKSLRLKLRREPIGVELLPKYFTLTNLQKMYETVLDIELDTRNFRKKLMKEHIVKKTEWKEKNVPHRAPTLYEFNQKLVEQKIEKGEFFEIY